MSRLKFRAFGWNTKDQIDQWNRQDREQRARGVRDPQYHIEKKMVMSEPFGIEDIGDDFDTGYFIAHRLEVNPFGKDTVLMQFTGLKDSKGFEIYEGDIFEIPDEANEGDGRKFYGIVVWDDEEAGWSLEGYATDPDDWFGTNEWYGDEIGTYGLTDPINPLVVIGNVYENPELLK